MEAEATDLPKLSASTRTQRRSHGCGTQVRRRPGFPLRLPSARRPADTARPFRAARPNMPSITPAGRGAVAGRYLDVGALGTVALSRNASEKPSKVEALLHGGSPPRARTTRPCL